MGYDGPHVIKRQIQEQKEDAVDHHGAMQLTDGQDNEIIVKHIRTTSKSIKAEKNELRIKQLEEVAATAPKLTLKVLSSGKLKGTVLLITAKGMKGGLRKAKDGVTYLGCKKHGHSNMERVVLNDFVIPSKDKEAENRHRGRHLQIKYSIEDEKYMVRDLGIGYGAFLRLDHPLELADNHLINIGESYIIVNMFNDRNSIVN